VDHDEAIGVLTREMETFRRESYADLVRRIGAEPFVCERTADSGVVYQLEIECLWETRAGGDVLVIGSVDDGGWRAFAPLTRSFIRAPDGSFVGE
jgi:hypothetical protein